MSVADLLAKADRRLIAAARDLEAGDIERSLSASYYAMFYAASAALESVEVARAKHSAVIAAFGEHFAKTSASTLAITRCFSGPSPSDPQLTTRRMWRSLGRRPRKPSTMPGPS